MTEALIPSAIHRDDAAITITWGPGHVATYPAYALRLQCHCAMCREEMTGRPLLDPATIAPDVRAVRVALVGTYALRVTWSDGHDTGIYTYEMLRAICPCDACDEGRRHGGTAAQP